MGKGKGTGTTATKHRHVPSGEHHGDGTCPGHVHVSVLFVDFWTWDTRAFPTKEKRADNKANKNKASQANQKI